MAEEWFDAARFAGLAHHLVAAENHPEQASVASASKDMSWHVYILQCENGVFYTGLTNDLDRRLQEHITRNGGRYTKTAKPKERLYSEAFTYRTEAEKREAQLKRWTRAKKQALIAGNLSQLRDLSVSRED